MIDIKFGEPGIGFTTHGTIDEIERLHILYTQLKLLEVLPVAVDNVFKKEFGDEEQ